MGDLAARLGPAYSVTVTLSAQVCAGGTWRPSPGDDLPPRSNRIGRTDQRHSPIPRLRQRHESPCLHVAPADIVAIYP